MTWRSLVLVCVLVPACSFVLVKEPHDATLTNREVPISCTTSRMFPLADLVLGAVLGGLIFATTYSAVESFNDECGGGGGCYRPWKPATLAAFLVVSPWWISSAVGVADTGRCRAGYRARGMPIR